MYTSDHTEDDATHLSYWFLVQTELFDLSPCSFCHPALMEWNEMLCRQSAAYWFVWQKDKKIRDRAGQKDRWTIKNLLQIYWSAALRISILHMDLSCITLSSFRSKSQGKTLDQRLIFDAFSLTVRPLWTVTSLGEADPPVRSADRLICKVSLSWSATMIIGPVALNGATITDNKHMILHVMAVKDLNLQQANRMGALWWCIWPNQSNILPQLDASPPFSNFWRLFSQLIEWFWLQLLI